MTQDTNDRLNLTGLPRHHIIGAFGPSELPWPYMVNNPKETPPTTYVPS